MSDTDVILSLQQEVERLRAALEPFAVLDASLSPSREDEEEIAVDVTIGDVRRARAALANDAAPDPRDEEIKRLRAALSELRIRVLGYYGPDHPYLPIIRDALEGD